MQPLTAEVELAGRVVLVRELTVSEIRAWLEHLRQGEVDLVDASLFEDCSVSDIRCMTDLSADEIGGLTPSQLRWLEAKCREVNADFFGMRARLAEVGRKVALPDFPEPSAP